MARNHTLTAIFAIICVALSITLQASAAGTIQSNQAITNQLGSRPLHFTENRGQWDERVLYKAEGAGGLTYFIERDGFTLLYSMPDLSAKPLENPRDAVMPEELTRNEPKVYPQKSHELKFKFIQSPPSSSTNAFSQAPDILSASISASPSGRLSWNDNYFLGNDPTKWAPNCGNFGAVKLNDVWKDIDIEWYASNDQVEFDFVVNPGADPSQVGLKIEGLTGDIEVTGNGEELLLPTSLGTLRFTLPEAFQAGDDSKTNPVPAHFTITGANRLGLALPQGYDAAKKLIVDPLVYARPFGGVNRAVFCAIIPDGMGGTIVAGYRNVLGWGSLSDAFVASESYCTYLGGNGAAKAFALAPDGAGGVIVAGSTYGDFPTTPGAFDRSHNGRGTSDAFIARLSADGTQLLYSTYLGGASNDDAHGIAPDGSGGIYVTGGTASNDFPTTAGAYENTPDGNYVAHLSMDEHGLLYSTFLGGNCYASAICLDQTSGVIVAGYTSSNDFPTTEGAYDRSFNGGRDGFITRLSEDGTELLYSTFLGGASDEEAYALVPDGAGGVIIAGYTDSNDFPTTEGSYDRSFNGSWDGYVARLNRDGTELLYSTYLGGSGVEYASGLALDGAGGIIIVGSTWSGDLPITEGALERSLSGSTSKIFLALLSGDLHSLLYSTYLGGSGNSLGYACALFGVRGVAIIGQTSNLYFPRKSWNRAGYEFPFEYFFQIPPFPLPPPPYTLFVPEDYATIQEAINASYNQDTVLVSPGTYNEDILLNGHSIILASRFLISNDSSDIETTIIHGTGRKSVITLESSAGWSNISQLRGFTITNGRGSLGGGIYLYKAKIVIDHCIIVGNTASKGGGIYALNSSPVIITNCCINNDSAVTLGGGIGIGGGQPSIQGCIISNNSAALGGGMMISSPTATIDSCIFDGNNAGIEGGGLRIYNCGPTTITNCTFSGNSAATLGGGIRIRGGHPIISNCMVSGNHADQGAGVNAISANGTVFSNCTFNSNTSTTLGGGMAISTSTATIDDCIFDGNNGGIQGGGLRIYKCGPTITNSTFGNNTATQGGGISAVSAGAVHLSNDTLINNAGIVVGGGIQLTSSNLTLDGCVISGNIAPQGGGMRLYISSPMVTHTAIVGNFAWYGGGFLCASGSNPTFTQCTFSNNVAGLGGTVWCSAGGNPSFNTCILYNDSQQEIYFHPAGAVNSVSLVYCDLKGGQANIVTNQKGTVTWGDGNFDSDPSFVGGGDYHIAIGSPCIDTGDLGLTNDPDATRADVGAFFYDQGIHRAPGLDVPKEASETPKEFALNSSYPNPFNSFTTIRFSLKEDSKARLTVYDLSGREVATLANGDLKAGSHSAVWNAEGFTSGIYLARLSTSSGFTATRKLTLLK